MNVIPFFKRFKFQSASKKNNFRLFSKATDIMVKKGHLTELGLIEILKIREKINPGIGRTRKYSIKDVLGESSTTIRQVRQTAE